MDDLDLPTAVHVPGGHKTCDDPLKNDPGLQLLPAAFARWKTW